MGLYRNNFNYSIKSLDYRKIRDRTSLIYIAGILILIYTVIFGASRNHAKSWLGSKEIGVQPSEFMK
ncbi:FtsW/RodA/SpoVE family cell cycle protein, partial [Treponema pedis]|uniref:FtsW/RodA/SpoVE family cell cycle protein n=1 Tax=Treponema pedis TaxID=409322 RepID=UPI001CEF9ED2